MAFFGEVLSPFIGFFLELIAALLVFARPLEKRKHFIRQVGLAAVAVVVVSTGCLTIYMWIASVMPANILDLSHNAVAISFGWCSVLFGLMAFIVWLTCAVTYREAVYCITCAYMIEHMAYCARILIGHLLPEVSNDAGTPVYFVSIAVFYSLGYSFFVRQMVRNHHYATTAVDSLWLSLGVLFVVMVMSLVATQFEFELLHSIYALICCGFALVGQVKQQKQLGLQKELNLQQQLWKQHKTQLEMSKENIEIINRKCHDLKHQVAALKYIHDPEKRSEVINSLQESVMIYDSILKTGNEVLDTVLTEKSLLCGQKEIALTCIADGALLSFLDAVDLYTLFGNALDNAIEAAQRLPQEERMIDLQVRQKAGLILISITNRFAGTVELGETLPKTSKEDKFYHGYGLKSIQSIAEKYGGILTLKTEDSLFRLRITIPIQR